MRIPTWHNNFTWLCSPARWSLTRFIAIMPLIFTTLPSLKLETLLLWRMLLSLWGLNLKILLIWNYVCLFFFLFFSHFSFVKDKRYCQAVKSLEFDRQLCPYNLSQYGDWKHFFSNVACFWLNILYFRSAYMFLFQSILVCFSFHVTWYFRCFLLSDFLVWLCFL